MRSRRGSNENILETETEKVEAGEAGPEVKEEKTEAEPGEVEKEREKEKEGEELQYWLPVSVSPQADSSILCTQTSVRLLQTVLQI